MWVKFNLQNFLPPKITNNKRHNYMPIRIWGKLINSPLSCPRIPDTKQGQEEGRMLGVFQKQPKNLKVSSMALKLINIRAISQSYLKVMYSIVLQNIK